MFQIFGYTIMTICTVPKYIFFVVDILKDIEEVTVRKLVIELIIGNCYGTTGLYSQKWEHFMEFPSFTLENVWLVYSRSTNKAILLKQRPLLTSDHIICRK